MEYFYDREKEEAGLMTILNNRPNLVHFIYGPINSGKTSLIMKVLENLPENTLYFYINFRGRDVSTTGDFLNQLSVKRIVYVSCNPTTQARDIKILNEKYKLEKIQPIDMFPHTYHIESVSLLERR